MGGAAEGFASSYVAHASALDVSEVALGTACEALKDKRQERVLSCSASGEDFYTHAQGGRWARKTKKAHDAIAGYARGGAPIESTRR